MPINTLSGKFRKQECSPRQVSSDWKQGDLIVASASRGRGERKDGEDGGDMDLL